MTGVKWIIVSHLKMLSFLWVICVMMLIVRNWLTFLTRETDRTTGFGFVTMSTVEEAEKAVEMFNRYI
ncbi:hypothetical protein AB3S75_010172 [Citrus x aurantiifolia]